MGTYLHFQAFESLQTMHIVVGTLLSLAFILAIIYYCVSLYGAMRKVPESKRVFPAWFVWLFLVPGLGVIFQWIMVPFGIPGSFKKACSDSPEAKRDVNTLFGIGLTKMICVLLAFLPYLGILFGLAAFILWIIYWVKVVSFKNSYLS